MDLDECISPSKDPAISMFLGNVSSFDASPDTPIHLPQLFADADSGAGAVQLPGFTAVVARFGLIGESFGHDQLCEEFHRHAKEGGLQWDGFCESLESLVSLCEQPNNAVRQLSDALATREVSAAPLFGESRHFPEIVEDDDSAAQTGAGSEWDASQWRRVDDGLVARGLPAVGCTEAGPPEHRLLESLQAALEAIDSKSALARQAEDRKRLLEQQTEQLQQQVVQAEEAAANIRRDSAAAADSWKEQLAMKDLAIESRQKQLDSNTQNSNHSNGKFELLKRQYGEMEKQCQRLKAQVQQHVEAEGRKRAAQETLFLQLMRRPPKKGNPGDTGRLDIISMYESQREFLEKELKSLNQHVESLNVQLQHAINNPQGASLSPLRTHTTEASSLPKPRARSPARAGPRASKPSVSPTSSPPVGKPNTRSAIRRDKQVHKMGSEAVSALQLPACHKLLQGCCVELALSDATQIPDALSVLSTTVLAVPKMERFISQIQAVASQVHGAVPVAQILSVLQGWADQIRASSTVKPQPKVPEKPPAPPAWAVLAAAELSETPGEEQAQKICSHFQHLFDVSSADGVLPKINEIYLFTEETRNMLTLIRSLLNLDRGAAVNTCVARLQEVFENPAVKQLCGPEPAGVAAEQQAAAEQEEEEEGSKKKPWRGDFGWR